MKSLCGCLALSLIFVGCSGSQQANVSTGNSATQTKEVATSNAESPSPTATPTPAAKMVEPPVEFAYLGVAPDKESIAYKIKVKTDEPISQVDIGVKYMDASGKVLDETTLAWQNVVKSVRQPIEKGKTYEGKDYLPEGATKAECVLKRVIFANGTRWNAD
jgi:hypothetical protein